MPLLERILSEIDAQGPIGVDRYMDLALNDPAEGYYATRPRLGAEGDFITAPHVSQMFGELLGLWAIEVWRGLGEPPRVTLAEMGPGDGTMMSDIWRAAVASPSYQRAARIVLVETSEPLARRQRERLDEHPGGHVSWVRRLEDLPGGAPAILIANEVLDCLPVRQGVVTASGPRERRIDRGPGDTLRFTASERPLAAPAWPGSSAPQEGLVFEVGEAARRMGAAVGERLMALGGAALFIDYGRDGPAWGDTLQALRAHRKVDPLAAPGEADLTAHADFPAFLEGARRAGARTSRILTQGEFLRRLGIEARADALARRNPQKADLILRQLERLVGARGMGVLFKVAAVWRDGAAAPPGLEKEP